MKKVFFVISLFLLILPVSFAASPVFYRGFAFFDGATASNGTIIQAFINNASMAASGVTIGQGVLAGLTPQGRYVISFEANTGDNISFLINGAALVAINGTNTSSQAITSGTLVVENFNLSANSSSNGVACTFASGCSGGYCVHSLCRSASTYCGDSFCDSGESCTSDNSACSSGQACTNGCVATSSGGGSSGGGGGGGSVSLPSETKTIGTITAGETRAVAITETSLPISTVEITAKETVSSVSVTVAEVSAPASISPPVSSVSGSVYRYIDITPSTTASNIQAGKIKFKVAKSWLNTNNIEETTVRLNRLVGTTWAKLSTTKVSEDGLNIYYEAVTPGFSTFAISGEKKSAVASAVCGNSIVEAGEDCDSTIGSHTCESLGFSSGTLKCTNCRYDTSGCNAQANPTPVCGNNIIEAGEDCDGTSITETCASKGFQSGSLKCNSSCKFDKSECISRSDAGYNPPGGEGVGGISYMSIVYVIVALIIIAGAGYWHYNKKPSKSAQ